MAITQSDSYRDGKGGQGSVITCKQVAKCKRIARATVRSVTPPRDWLIKGFAPLDKGHASRPAIGKPTRRSTITELILQNVASLLQRAFCMPACSRGVHSASLLSSPGIRILCRWQPLYQNQTALKIIALENWRHMCSFKRKLPNIFFFFKRRRSGNTNHEKNKTMNTETEWWQAGESWVPLLFLLDSNHY